MIVQRPYVTDEELEEIVAYADGAFRDADGLLVWPPTSSGEEYKYAARAPALVRDITWTMTIAFNQRIGVFPHPDPHCLLWRASWNDITTEDLSPQRAILLCFIEKRAVERKARIKRMGLKDVDHLADPWRDREKYPIVFR